MQALSLVALVVVVGIVLSMIVVLMVVLCHGFFKVYEILLAECL